MRPSHRRRGHTVRRALQSLACALVLGWGVTGAMAAEHGDLAIARLEAALVAFPDDPDLLWALGRERARIGDTQGALDAMRAFVSLWPDRRPDAHLELGRLLVEAGRFEEALAALNTALRVNPDSGSAYLYRALAFRKLNRRDEADAALEHAVALSPALEPEVLLLRALNLFDAHQEAAAVLLLRRVLEIDPTGEAAERARLLLAQPPRLRLSRWLRLDARAGLEWDSNVSLENQMEGGGLRAGGQSDGRSVLEARAAFRPLYDRRYGLTLGYRIYSGIQFQDSDYDHLANMVFASSYYRPAKPVTLALSASFLDFRLDGSPYFRLGSLRPQAIFDFGDQFGTTRLFADFECQRYADAPQLPPFEHDAFAYGGGIEHSLNLLRRGAVVRVGTRFERTDTEARADPAFPDFRGDYDRDLWEGTIRFEFPLIWEVVSNLSFIVGHEDYAYDNFQGYWTSGFADQEKRRDTFGELWFSLVRPLGRYLELELAWRGIHRDSNIETLAYRRQVVGLYLRAATE